MCCTLCYIPSLRAQVIISTLAGNGTAAYGGDHGAATAAQINNPNGVAVDAIGNVYIADYGNFRVRKVDTFGVITTIAGTGTSGTSGDGGPATAAPIHSPVGIAVDNSGDVLFTDACKIRKITMSTGVITTICGSSLATYSGDGGPAVAADLNYPTGIAVDPANNIYIADQFNCRVRKINTSGIISTIVGDGICGPVVLDGVPSTASKVQYPRGVACDGAGNIYIADYGNNRIRKIDATGIITTIAGSPTYGFTGDGGPSTAARLYYPMAIAADAAGNVFISDVNNARIRQINTSGVINSITGTGTDGYSGDGGAPVTAQINRSTGVAVDALGRIYIADNNNNRIRYIHLPPHSPHFMRGRVASFSTCQDRTIFIDTFLAASDIDFGQTLTWSVLQPALHGLLSASYTAPSTGGIVTPSGKFYAASSTYTGLDSFTMRVDDGGLADTMKIYVTILPPPTVGPISGVDSICPGDTVTFSDTSAGGSWASSTTGIASVGTSGFVTGGTPGVTTISYTVMTPCGPASATYTLKVRSNCPNEVPVVPGGQTLLQVLPNPGDGHMSVTLRTNEPGEVLFAIYNALGERIKEFSGEANKATDIFVHAAPGIYTLWATDGSGRYAQKICIVQ